MEESKSDFLEAIRESERLANEDKDRYSQICDDFAEFILKNNCKEQDEDDE